MTVINISNLSATIGVPLFSDLDLAVSKADRIGVVAANGLGKSTLLSCIAGEFEYTTGEITRARGARVGYVKQYPPAQTLTHTFYEWVLAALPREQSEYESWRVDVLLNELMVPYEIQHETLASLSGGWQRTAMLAAAWINEPDVLLLDEPTNHLDLSRISLLEGWLGSLSAKFCVVLVSHDRAFLDSTTNRTLFLRPERSRVFQLPYTKAREALYELDATDERKLENDRHKASQLRRQAAKLKNVGINSGSDLLLTKTKQLVERADKIDAAARPVHSEQTAGDIKLANSGTHAKALITFNDVSVETPDGRLLYRTGQKWVARGDRIVLLGANGVGKSQLVKLIQDAFHVDGSVIKCASSIVPAYSDQHLSQLLIHKSPMDAVAGQFDIGDQRAHAVLAGAGIDIQLQDKDIQSLSGGQKARLAMLLIRLKNPNFYLLDEPTNHLDVDGQEAMEEELIAHDTSCILVSHDRSFLRNVGNRFWWIKNKKLHEVKDAESFFEEQMRGPIS